MLEIDPFERAQPIFVPGQAAGLACAAAGRTDPSIALLGGFCKIQKSNQLPQTGLHTTNPRAGVVSWLVPGWAQLQYLSFADKGKAALALKKGPNSRPGRRRTEQRKLPETHRFE